MFMCLSSQCWVIMAESLPRLLLKLGENYLIKTQLCLNVPSDRRNILPLR